MSVWMHVFCATDEGLPEFAHTFEQVVGLRLTHVSEQSDEWYESIGFHTLLIISSHHLISVQGELDFEHYRFWMRVRALRKAGLDWNTLCQFRDEVTQHVFDSLKRVPQYDLLWVDDDFMVVADWRHADRKT